MGFFDEEDEYTAQAAPYISGNGFGGGLLDVRPTKKRGFSPDLGMLGLAAGLLEPTRGGKFSSSLANGLSGWASGIASQRKLDMDDAENDPDAIMRKYAMQAQAKAQAEQLYGGGEPLHGVNVRNEYLMLNPRTGDVVKRYPITASQNSLNTLAVKGLRMTDDGQVEPIPGYGSAMGANKFAENKPLEDYKLNNDIYGHQQKNASDIQKENDKTPIVGNQRFSEKTGEHAANRYDSILKEGTAAQDDLMNYSKLDSILTDFEGGKLSGMRQSLGEFANSLGIKDLDPNLDEKQLFESVVGKSALERLKQMGGNDSNQDREFAMKMGPSLTQTANGRKQIINFYKGIANQRVLRSQMAQKWVQSFGRIDAPNQSGQTFEQRWTDWVNRNPVAEKLQ